MRSISPPGPGKGRPVAPASAWANCTIWKGERSPPRRPNNSRAKTSSAGNSGLEVKLIFGSRAGPSTATFTSTSSARAVARTSRLGISPPAPKVMFARLRLSRRSRTASVPRRSMKPPSKCGASSVPPSLTSPPNSASSPRPRRKIARGASMVRSSAIGGRLLASACVRVGDAKAGTPGGRWPTSRTPGSLRTVGGSLSGMRNSARRTSNFPESRLSPKASPAKRTSPSNVALPRSELMGRAASALRRRSKGRRGVPRSSVPEPARLPPPAVRAAKRVRFSRSPSAVMAAAISFNEMPCCKSRKLPLAILACPPRRGAARLPSSRRLILAVPATRCAPAASSGCARLPRSTWPVMLPESGASALSAAIRAVAASRTAVPPLSEARISAPAALPVAEATRRKGGTPRAAGTALVIAGLSNRMSKRGSAAVPFSVA